MKKNLRIIGVSLIIVIIISVVIKYGVPYYKYHDNLYRFETHSYLLSGKGSSLYKDYSDEIIKEQIINELKWTTISLADLEKMTLKKKEEQVERKNIELVKYFNRVSIIVQQLKQ